MRAMSLFCCLSCSTGGIGPYSAYHVISCIYCIKYNSTQISGSILRNDFFYLFCTQIRYIQQNCHFPLPHQKRCKHPTINTTADLIPGLTRTCAI